MSTIGYGESRPIADNNAESGRQINRRVEITIAPRG
jgi:outer membrane protein OmpA-like peptidoglycan-associated protein